MPLITSLPKHDAVHLETVKVCVDRLNLQKKRWRIKAEDGEDIAIDLDGHCHQGELIYISADKRYVIEQAQEAVIIIDIPTHPDEAAMRGWVFGNQHIPIQIKDGTIRVASDESVKMFLERNHIHYTEEKGLFCPSPHSRVHHHH